MISATKGYMYRIKQYFDSFLPDSKSERTKVFLLTASFFCIIAGYTIAKELKDAMFVAIVGKEYIAYAKMVAIVLLIPAVMLYSRFVDSLHRYQLLMLYTFAFGTLGIIFSIFLGHSVIGIPNTDSSPYRLFGWFFYLFIEGYSPFIVSVFWAFSNSINSPQAAKRSYGIMVAGSKVGGMASAGLAWLLLSYTDPLSYVNSHTLKHQILLGASSALLLFVPLIIWILTKKVSETELQGYKAVYRADKQREKDESASTGLFSGLAMLIKYPYAFGIFAIVLFYEVMQTILNYQRIVIAKEGATNLSEFSASLFSFIFFTHAVGLIISLFGTSTLLNRWGEKACLLLVPISMACLYGIFRIYNTQLAFTLFFVGVRGIHYGLSYPVRESLYILTVKEIKFKTKSWIDAFGSKFAKAGGSLFNTVTEGLGASLFVAVQSGLFAVIIGVWVVIAYFLGNRFEKAVARNEVIGLEQE